MYICRYQFQCTYVLSITNCIKSAFHTPQIILQSRHSTNTKETVWPTNSFRKLLTYSITKVGNNVTSGILVLPTSLVQVALSPFDFIQPVTKFPSTRVTIVNNLKSTLKGFFLKTVAELETILMNRLNLRLNIKSFD